MSLKMGVKASKLCDLSGSANYLNEMKGMGYFIGCEFKLHVKDEVEITFKPLHPSFPRRRES